MSTPAELDCLQTDYLVCPYCGSVDYDCWELTAEDADTECGSCGRKFGYSRYVSITYSSRPIIGPHELDEFWQKQEQES